MNYDLDAGYEETLREFRLDFSRGGAYTGVALVLLGVGLDYALYREHQEVFFYWRLVVSILLYVAVLLMRTDWGKKNIQGLTFAWLLMPQIMIAWMIGVTDGATSIYYAGLNLAIYASGIVLSFGMWQNIVFGTTSYVAYVIACWFHPESFYFHGAFLVNSLFLIFGIVTSAVFTYFNERARYLLFRLKAEVAQKNTQLEATNKSLANVKGQLLQQEKMAAIGTLAAGLLHEINNPVNFCLMAVNLAMEEPKAKESATLAECLVDIKDGMQRVQRIVSDLKIFAYRKADAEAVGAPFIFEKALNSAERLTAHELRGIEMVRNLPSDNLVYGDEAAIIGVMINLFSNAALAMQKTDSAKSTIKVSAEWVENRLHIAVRDSGPGIPAQNLSRVFEPFFTTREIGQGLGLGLSICYSIIERHGGVLAASSVLGEWTEFAFDLPRAE